MMDLQLTIQHTKKLMEPFHTSKPPSLVSSGRSPSYESQINSAQKAKQVTFRNGQNPSGLQRVTSSKKSLSKKPFVYNSRR